MKELFVRERDVVEKCALVSVYLALLLDNLLLTAVGWFSTIVPLNITFTSSDFDSRVFWCIHSSDFTAFCTSSWRRRAGRQQWNPVGDLQIQQRIRVAVQPLHPIEIFCWTFPHRPRLPTWSRWQQSTRISLELKSHRPADGQSVGGRRHSAQRICAATLRWHRQSNLLRSS